MKKIILIPILMLVFCSFAFALFENADAVYYTIDNADRSGNNIYDVSSNTNNATNAGATLGVAGEFNEAANFDAINDRFLTTDHASIQNVWDDTGGTDTGGAMTVWINASSNGEGNAGRIFDKGVNTLRSHTSNGTHMKLRFTLNRGGTNGIWETTGYVIEFNVSTHVVVNYNASSTAANPIIYINNASVAVTETSTPAGVRASDAGTNLAVGNRAAATDFTFDNMIDEFGLFTRMLTAAEIEHLFVSGQPYNLSITSNLDLLFTNKTNTTFYQSAFDIGEDIFSWANWTYAANGSAITTGACNFTYFNAFEEEDATNESFNLCNSGCDFNAYTETFTPHTNESVANDSIHLNVCHSSGVTADLSITATCNSGTKLFTIPKATIPRCSIGTIELFLNFTDCITDPHINFTLDNIAANPANGHNVSELSFDREYSTHVVEGVYNSTQSLWRANHTLEYYESGTKTINVNCTHVTTTTLNNNHSETITIAKLPPDVLFNNVVTGLGTTSLSNLVVIEYAAGVWTWSIIIDDTDFTEYNITFYNSSDIIYTIENQTVNKAHTTPDATFRDFHNNFKIVVDVTDGTFIVQENLSFVLNDTIVPTITWVNPLKTNTTTQVGNFTFCYDVNFTDESLYSYYFNLSKSPTFATNVTSNWTNSLTPTTHNFDGCINLTGNGTGRYYTRFKICDAHTNNNIGDLHSGYEPVLEGLKYVNDQILIYPVSNDVKTYKTDKQLDRYTFDYEFNNEYNNLKFIVASNCSLEYIKDSKYNAHFVACGKYWIDFEEFDGDKYQIKSTSVAGFPHAYEVDITFKKAKKLFKFQSLGELNCITQEASFVLASTPTTSGNLSAALNCGDKILDDNFTINLDANTSVSCTLRNNEYLIATNSSACRFNVTQDYFFGQNDFSLVFANGTIERCTVWKDTTDRGLDEYLYYVMFFMIIGFFMVLSMKLRSGAMLLIGGLTTIFTGLSFYTLSNMVGVLITVGGIVMIMLSFNNDLF